MFRIQEPNWQKILKGEFEKKYYKTLSLKVEDAYRNSTVYPTPELLFNAFSSCPFNTVKVVILGQDPYHGHGQAHGLSFSVPQSTPIPPSLKNIQKEIIHDIGKSALETGNLQFWANQGVLLLNSTLTVEDGKPGSHQKIGWETFTDTVIELISKEKSHVVFLLWGAFAQSKAGLIDANKHLILQSAHPSPLSAYRGFLGCKHFSQTNNYLQKNKHTPIVW